MGKKYAAAEAQVTEELYAPLEAMALVKDIAFANFDETVDVDIRLNLDTRQADQQLRGTVSLPNGSGKTVRVAVFAEGDAARAAEEAGADIVGSDDLIADIQGGKIDFDATVATPEMMAKVGRLGRDPRYARSYAEPQARHGYARCCKGSQGAQRRPR